MPARTPTGPPPPPVVQRLRLRYAKRGPLRFTSHRDVARAFERAVQRAGLPVAFSAGFSPHPRISWVGASPTGAASEAEYVEIGLAEVRDPVAAGAALDRALPVGLDVLECVPAGPGALADRVTASRWLVVLPGAPTSAVEAAVAAFLARDRVEVQRRTREGRRPVDARVAVVSVAVRRAGELSATADAGWPDAALDAVSRHEASDDCAILDLVVRHTTPAVRPDDVVAGLRSVAGLVPPMPLLAMRLAQGPLDPQGLVHDPLAPDRAAGESGSADEAHRGVD